MIIIVAGSRGFLDYGLLMTTLDMFPWPITEIVSGSARGADTLGERYAREKGIPIKLFPAQWDRHGRSAGYRRNVEMAAYADALIAFWDGHSRGTEHMIEEARKRNLIIKIIRYP